MSGIGNIIGFIEAVEITGIVGWAFRQFDQKPLQLKLFIDGRFVSDISCCMPREDVWETRKDIREECRVGPNLGFEAAIPGEYFDGVSHDYIVTEFVDEEAPLINIESRFGGSGKFSFAAISVLSSIELDLQAGQIFGWVAVLDRRSGTIRTSNRIQVTSSSGVSEEIVGNLSRPDVSIAVGCGENCGFKLDIEDYSFSSLDEIYLSVLPENMSFDQSPFRLEKPSFCNADDIDDVVDPDDGRVQFTGIPRSSIFGIGKTLRKLRRELLIKPMRKTFGPYEEDIFLAMSKEFDYDYYLSSYPDVALSSIDPLIHYAESGWIEGRKPAAWFDTEYYLAVNPDIRSAQVNPFWHYLAVGRAEGRRTVRVGGYRRRTVEEVVAPEEKARNYVRASIFSQLSLERLQDYVFRAVVVSRGLALSIGQDNYVKSTGGIQIFIADEQKGFKERSFAYLNLSPLDPDLIIAEPESRAFYHAVLDGTYLGIASYQDVIAAVSSASIYKPLENLFLVHCVLGHTVDRLLALHDALKPRHSFFWLHDFSSLCAGYNLLRNDVEFCGAPEPTSVSCRICIYGKSRPAHLSKIDHLFSNILFNLVAPSRSASAIWHKSSKLPHKQSLIHPHCIYDENARRIGIINADRRGFAESPIRVAFIGYPTSHKGWPAFEELVKRTSNFSCYQFFHFISNPGELHTLGGIKRVIAQTSASTRDAMIEAVATHAIDIVLVLSPWPETFSYVTYEALAAGSDVIAFEDSGNVADVVLSIGRGLVVDDEYALFDLFESLRIVEYVRQRDRQEVKSGILVHSGTTATIDFATNLGESL